MIDLYNGDCLEVMQNIEEHSVDLILCDLPYGVTACEWDKILDYNKLWECYKRVLKENGAVLLFGIEPFSSELRLSNRAWYKYDIYWEKERLSNINQVKKRVGKTVETISVFYKKQPTYNPQMIKYEGPKRTNRVKNGKLGKLTDEQGNKKVKEYNDTGLRYPTQVWRFKRDCLTSNLHPTQKPIALLEELIKTFTNEGDMVLDNCMGSGSTGVACKNLGRDFIGIELNEEFYNIAVQRINVDKG